MSVVEESNDFRNSFISKLEKQKENYYSKLFL